MLVDADSVHRDIRSIILRRAVRNHLEAFFVADRSLDDVKRAIEEDTRLLRYPHRLTMEKSELRAIRSRISMIVVESGANSADDRIVEIASSPSLAITHDIPLAARLIEKGILVMDDRGHEYSKENIRERLSLRDCMTEFRNMGIKTAERQDRITQRTIQEFSNTFDRLCNLVFHA